MESTLIIISTVISAVCLLGIVILLAKRNDNSNTQQFEKFFDQSKNDQRALREEISTTTQHSINGLGNVLSTNQATGTKILEDRLKTFSTENEQKLENIRTTIEAGLRHIQTDNNQKLDEMRKTVDEKLQSTLESKMNESFKLVSERLEQVHKGLGEMQTLASGVGDLKKMMSNVKTRGIIGEIQLGSILKEILSPEQYEENVVTKKGSTYRVEFAIKLPSDDGEFIYLPIDSKFPGDTYMNLRDAYDNGARADIDLAVKALIDVIKGEAKDIRDKYIDVPNTTNFAIMFLPFEGLYSEVVNRGLIEILQRDYKVNVAGPSTMAALLNSLQMGFRTLAVQKRSNEVWQLLSEVKTEFGTFNTALKSTQNRLRQADEELEKLVGTRSRAMERRLRNVQSTEKELAE